MERKKRRTAAPVDQEGRGPHLQDMTFVVFAGLYGAIPRAVTRPLTPSAAPRTAAARTLPFCVMRDGAAFCETTGAPESHS